MKKISNSKTLSISVYLIGIFLIIETVGGILSNSLALLADAGHMLSDFLAILLSLIAHKYLSKPADGKRSYGYGRMQIIASFVNGITLVGISIVITVTAIIRIFSPPEVDSVVMIFVSFVGIIVNGITLYTLHLSEEKNLNMRGAILHIIGDLMGFTAALVGAIVIKYTNLYIIDPILSILISLLILNSAVRLIKESMHILMEGAPNDVTEDEIRSSLMSLDGISDVHHIHLWLLDDSYKVVTLHIIVDENSDPFSLVKAAQKVLEDKHNIQHSTVAVERYDKHTHQSRDYDHHHRVSIINDDTH